MRRWSRDYLLASILGAIAVILGLAVALEWAVLAYSGDGDSGPSPARTAPVDEGAAEAQKEFELPGLDGYVQMAEHPLFMENRRPGAEATESAAPPPPPTPMSLKLMGVVRTPDDVTALIMDGKGKYKRLKLHDPPFDGWTLVELGQDQVTLQQGDRREVLPLLKKHPKPPAGAPATPGQPMPVQPIPGQPQPGQPPRPGPMPPVPPPNAAAGEEDQDLPEEETDIEAVDEDTDTNENP